MLVGKSRTLKGDGGCETLNPKNRFGPKVLEGGESWQTLNPKIMLVKNRKPYQEMVVAKGDVGCETQNSKRGCCCQSQNIKQRFGFRCPEGLGSWPSPHASTSVPAGTRIHATKLTEHHRRPTPQRRKGQRREQQSGKPWIEGQQTLNP